MENHLYECIYDVLQQSSPSDNLPVLNRLKAKTVGLHSIRLQNILLDNTEADRIDEEQPSLHHILQMRRKRTRRTIHCLRDESGHMQMTSSRIAQTLNPIYRKCMTQSSPTANV